MKLLILRSHRSKLFTPSQINSALQLPQQQVPSPSSPFGCPAFLFKTAQISQIERVHSQSVCLTTGEAPDVGLDLVSGVAEVSPPVAACDEAMPATTAAKDCASRFVCTSDYGR